jgi:short-subunit dehydrogenase
MAVLITGGSEGIGFELAKLYAADGFDLILAARDPQKLEQAAQRLKSFSAAVQTIALDLSVPGSAERLYQEVKARGLHVDVLVNDAGFGLAGCSWQLPLDQEERLVGVNDIALMSLTKLYLRDMAAEGRGIILNIGSTGAFQPGPYIASYYASKSFVLSYTRAAACEAAGTGVKIHCFCPGPVDTGFYARSGGHKPSQAMSAAAAAEYAYTRQHSRRVVLLPGFVNHLALAVPSGWRMRLVAAMKKRYLKQDKEKAAQ